MSQLQIVEASAGSGKTHRLVFEYLRLLLLNPDNYQHILAVTFTNKATEEMKSRIILELSKLQHICNSSCNPSCERASAHLSSLSENLKLSAEDIAQKAGIALYNILHNYSRFSIMTIDSFFQQILRAFLREVGLGTSTRIELDEEWVIQQTVDQLLLDLDAGDELYQWLVHYMLEQIAQGKSWSVSEKL
ncbi:MAG TPA: UvrD-helicase domain-containing protein, partial [Bacteroidales bacterium]|nr:UvrD-helicase domain-containing protein [Bacteroidales bacterium]